MTNLHQNKQDDIDYLKDAIKMGFVAYRLRADMSVSCYHKKQSRLKFYIVVSHLITCLEAQSPALSAKATVTFDWQRIQGQYYSLLIQKPSD